MVKRRVLGTPRWPWALGLLAALFLAACAPAQAPAPTPLLTATPVPGITVSMLIQVSPTDLRWFRDVEVPKGTDAYELTERVTQGNLKATWYPAFRSHFVEGVVGVEGKAPFFWLAFLWNESEKKWEPLPVGADLYSLKEGHVLAWAYTDTSVTPGPVPVATP